MSKKFLRRILKEETKRLEKDLRAKSDKKVHIFRVDKALLFNEIRQEVIDQSNLSNQSLDSRELEKTIDKASQIIFDNIERYLKNLGPEGAEINYLSKDHFDVIVKESEGAKSFTGKIGWHKTVFETIKNSFKSGKLDALEEINKFIRKRKSGQEIKQENFLNIGHIGSSAVARQQVGESVGRIKKRLEKNFSPATVKKYLKDLKIDVILSKVDTKILTEIEVKLEASGPNQQEGSDLLAKLKDDLTKTLKEGLGKLDQLAYLKGSDSRVEIEEKKILGAFQDKLKTSKNLRLTERADTKLNLSNSIVSNSIKIKQKAGKSESLKGVKTKPLRNRKTSSEQSIIGLAALINQKLPQTVMANMKPPALQNRTGRFAQSVRITDVITTSKGYPSIGYTYRKDPYQTFEIGYKQGSKDRDPRNLIDKSIREIAAELLVGRFFTRRN